MFRRGWISLFGVTLLLLVGAAPAQGQQAAVIQKVTPKQVAQGSQNVKLKIEGKNFVTGAKVSFSGSGISTVGDPVIRPTEIHVTVSVLATAPLGLRHIRVRNPDTVGPGGRRVIGLAGTGKEMLYVTPPVAVPAPK